VTEPFASRPHMPGYGLRAAGEGTGLLPWSWALTRLRDSHAYWVATVWPDGRPHVVPVWGVWLDGALWFSSGLQARKARNLLAEPRCSMTTDDAHQPVVLDGVAERITALDRIAGFADTVDSKYATTYGPDFYDPATNAVFRVPPRSVFALDDADFTGSPTRWFFSCSAVIAPHTSAAHTSAHTSP
jgi:PPOX class probable F420-dependent enzyme